MSRIVITGGAGFLGSHLTDYYLARGDEVVVVDNFSSGRLANLVFAESNFPDQLVVMHRNVNDGLYDVRGRVDAVLHLASPASPPRYQADPLGTLQTGSEGTLSALRLAESRDAVFLLASTSEVYGDPEVHPQPETYNGNVSTTGPRSMYDEAKRYAEALTRAFGEGRQHYKVARIFNTYGPRMDPFDGRVLPTFIRQALAGEPLTVHGDGSQTRSLCFVDDMVRGLDLLLWNSWEAGPVNLGSTEEVTVLQLAQLVLHITRSHSTIEFVQRQKDDPERRRPEISRAEFNLEWSPIWSLEDGVRETIRDARLAVFA